MPLSQGQRGPYGPALGNPAPGTGNLGSWVSSFLDQSMQIWKTHVVLRLSTFNSGPNLF